MVSRMLDSKKLDCEIRKNKSNKIFTKYKEALKSILILCLCCSKKATKATSKKFPKHTLGTKENKLTPFTSYDSYIIFNTLFCNRTNR